MRQCLLPAALLALLVSSAHAEEASPSDKNATLVVERHVTSNALDSDLALRDSYTLLRGALARDIPIVDGKLRLSTEFQASLYDRYAIEDDRALALSLEGTRRFGDRLEVRGSLSWRRYSEGDDLAIGPVVLGTRTVTDTLAAGIETGIDMGGGTVLLLGALDTFDKPGLTRFQDDLITPTPLKPERNTASLSAGLKKTLGPTSYALTGSVDLSRADPFPLGVSYAKYALRAETRTTTADGTVFAAALGGEWLRAERRLYDELRPTVEVSAVKALPGGIELRGSYAASYVTRDTDDPLASWVERLEIEAKKALTRQWLFAVGYFAENRENLLLAYDERSRGVYGQIAYAVRPDTAIVLRVDCKRDRLTVIDVDKPVFDAYLGVTRKL